MVEDIHKFEKMEENFHHKERGEEMDVPPRRQERERAHLNKFKKFKDM